MNTPSSSIDIDRFRKDGFLILPDFVETEVIDLLRRVATVDSAFLNKVRTGKDHAGHEVKLWISNRLEENLFSGVVCYDKIVRSAERLLGEEVYQWHHKFILKDAHAGGAWEWHQDYGYWYDYGCLLPDLVSCMIAIDPATRENGCLQIIRGSHRMGRLDTSRVADQTGVEDAVRLRSIISRFEVVDCELNPGDVVFFHANALHKSDINRQKRPRWAFISVYNTASNSPGEHVPVHAHDEDAPPTPMRLSKSVV